jgi:hypothetical protein
MPVSPLVGKEATDCRLDHDAASQFETIEVSTSPSSDDRLQANNLVLHYNKVGVAPKATPRSLDFCCSEIQSSLFLHVYGMIRFDLWKPSLDQKSSYNTL